MRRVLGFAMLLLAVRSSPAEAAGAGEPVGLALSIDLVSRLIWRGYELHHQDPDSLVYLTWSPAAVPGLSLETGVITGLRNDPEQGDDESSVDEWDLRVTYEWELVPGELTVALGALSYRYTSDWTQGFYEDDEDYEASCGLKWSAGEHLVPRLTYYRGLDDLIEGNYVEAGLVTPWTFANSAWSIEPSLVVAYSDQYGVDHEITHTTFSLPWSYAGETTSWTLHLEYTHLFEPEVLNDDPEDEILYGGINFTASW